MCPYAKIIMGRACWGIRWCLAATKIWAWRLFPIYRKCVEAPTRLRLGAIAASALPAVLGLPPAPGIERLKRLKISKTSHV